MFLKQDPEFEDIELDVSRTNPKKDVKHHRPPTTNGKSKLNQLHPTPKDIKRRNNVFLCGFVTIVHKVLLRKKK